MNRFNKLIPGILVLALACAGCAGIRMKKISEKDLPMPLFEATDHAKDVLNTCGFDIQVIDKHDGSLRLEGKHADGQDVEVNITPMGRTRSHVKIRVTNESPRISAKTILDDIAVRYE